MNASCYMCRRLTRRTRASRCLHAFATCTHNYMYITIQLHTRTRNVTCACGWPKGRGWVDVYTHLQCAHTIICVNLFSYIYECVMSHVYRRLIRRTRLSRCLHAFAMCTHNWMGVEAEKMRVRQSERERRQSERERERARERERCFWWDDCHTDSWFGMAL